MVVGRPDASGSIDDLHGTRSQEPLLGDQGGYRVVPGLLDHLVKNETERQIILHQLFRILGIPPPPAHKPFYFPGSIPVSLRRRDLATICSATGGYVVTEKTDGTRYLLVLCRIDNEPRAYLVNRRCDVYRTPVAADASFFKGTVLDGELVAVTDKQTPDEADEWGDQILWVFDLLAIQGRSLLGQIHADRYRLQSVLFEVNPPCLPSVLRREEFTRELARRQNLARQRHVIVPLYQRLTLRAKAFLNVKDLPHLLPAISERPYPVDGLIFMPSGQKVVLGTDWCQFKWKMYQTVDLLLEVHGPGPLALVSLAYRTRHHEKEFALDILRHGILLNEDAYIHQRERPLQPLWQHFRFNDDQGLMGYLLQQLNVLREQAGFQPYTHWEVECAVNGAAPTGPMQAPGHPLHFNDTGTHPNDADGPPLSMQAGVHHQTFLVETLVRMDPQIVLPAGGLGAAGPAGPNGADPRCPLPLHLVPCKLRHDKLDPNNDWTVQQTVFHVLENISVEDLRARVSAPTLQLGPPQAIAGHLLPGTLADHPGTKRKDVEVVEKISSPPPPPRKRTRYDPERQADPEGQSVMHTNIEDEEYDPLNPSF